jgi:prolipoprotein diacylglyceryltransferase
MALYVMAYTAGRGWIEYLRIDDVQLNDVLGLRFNVWTSIVLFAGAAAYFAWASRKRPGRETEIYRHDDAGVTDATEETERASTDD